MSEKKPRIFEIDDRLFKILCMADKKNFNPTVGLENICAIYESLAGPIDFSKLDIERAIAKAKALELT